MLAKSTVKTLRQARYYNETMLMKFFAPWSAVFLILSQPVQLFISGIDVAAVKPEYVKDWEWLEADLKIFLT